MKNFLFFLILVFSMSINSFAQIDQADQKDKEMLKGPIMTFESTVVDYGEIAQHSDPLRIIKFTNTGVEPLIIKSARGSCGCTVPTWPKEAIMPGETSQIEIRYDTKRLGNINKKVTINTNEGGDPHVLSVVGTINKTDESEGVPKAPKTIIGKKKKNN